MSNGVLSVEHLILLVVIGVAAWYVDRINRLLTRRIADLEDRIAQLEPKEEPND